ncbi:RagB/SusD family nutrient uptake outer membrane protein [Bacteroides sp.]|uniref:RagB/SusD family nutrient uptake outer membrane protein n=1 Tax=Bacteroides sp. TaxID=29523 RepID=UPI002FC7CD6A
MKTYIKIALSVLVISSLFTSCEDLLTQTNPNKATEDTFWKNEADFNLALTSCYTPLKNALNGGYYGTRGVMLRISRADEVDFRNDISDIYTTNRFTNSTSNSLTQGMFYQFYNALYRTNSIMQKLEEKGGQFSTEFQNAVKGECLFIRGFYLFQLAKEFKDAPLKLTASQSPATFPLAKSSQAEIWAQAKKDLETAASLLPISNVVGKPTQGAAFAALGKIYLYEENWQKAIDILLPLTKAPYTYKLVDFDWNFDDIHENNAESIFELLIEDVGGTDLWGNGENINSTQSNTRPKEYAAAEVGGWYEANPTQQMMNIFLKEKDKTGNFDYRARCSVAWDYDGCTYYQKPFRKVFAQDKWNTYWILKYQNWKTRSDEPSPPKSFINERAIRYAEVILQLAEANLNVNKLDEAIGYLNQIRQRANLNDYSGAKTKEGIFADLVHQRAIEFFVEGERFYDLRRWGLLKSTLETCDEVRYKNYMGGEKGSFNKFNYYPIPTKEIDNNPLCTPSEGW